MSLSLITRGLVATPNSLITRGLSGVHFATNIKPRKLPYKLTELLPSDVVKITLFPVKEPLTGTFFHKNGQVSISLSPREIRHVVSHNSIGTVIHNDINRKVITIEFSKIDLNTGVYRIETAYKEIKSIAVLILNADQQNIPRTGNVPHDGLNGQFFPPDSRFVAVLINKR